MKLLHLITFLALLIIGISAYDSQRQVLITYPHDTTSSYLAEARIRIEAAVRRTIPVSFHRLFPTIEKIRLWLTYNL